jgi:hypothetical protein
MTVKEVKCALNPFQISRLSSAASAHSISYILTSSRVPNAHSANNTDGLLIIVDDYTRYSWCYGLPTRDISDAWATWRKLIDTHHGRRHGNLNEEIKIAGVRADPGGKYLSDKWIRTLKDGGSTLDQTISRMHFQVGVAERSFQDVVTHAVSILHDANLPECLWFHVSQTVVFLKNLWPHSHLDYYTPFERIWGRKPDLSFLRVIGSKSWVLIPKEDQGHKFLLRAKVCRLLGYISSGQYVFCHSTRKEP